MIGLPGSEDDGMEVPFVPVQQIGDFLCVPHVILVRVAEDGSKLVRIADIDVAPALLGEKANPSAVRSRFHPDGHALVRKKERFKFFALVGHPPLEDDVCLFVESDDCVLFVA